jgi:hypothetical protein
VGTVKVIYGADGFVTVNFDMEDGYKLDETHVYAGYEMFQQVSRGKKTIPTVAPGIYTNEGPFEGPIYVIVHAVVCGSFEQKSAEIVTRGLEASDLKVYPNPFSDKITFEFVSAKDARARLEINNVLGQRIAVLMNENVKEGVMIRVEYEPVDVATGILIYRLILDDGVQSGRIIYKKE